MNQYTVNDIKVLLNIGNKKNVNKGTTLMTATTVDEIIERTELSSSKVRQSLRKFLKDELIINGIKKVNKKTYCITAKGIDVLDKLKEYR